MITPATPADAPAVIALWHLCGLTRPWNDPASDYDRALSGPSSAILVSRAQGTGAIIGSVMIGHDGHRGWVYYLAVDPDQQGRGGGAALMAAAEQWLAQRAVPAIRLMVRSDNAQAMGFYAGLGYERQDVVTLGRNISSKGGAR